MAAIRIDNAVKRFGDVTALNHVSLEVETGQTVAVLGPNGAGKTTLIDMLVGLARLTSGNIEVLGHVMPKESRWVREHIGLCLQSTTAFFPRLTVRETLSLYQRFFTQRRNIDELLERMQLTEKAGQPVSKLSGGQQQRVALAAALVNDPEVLFLDEPTTGLDPQARRDIWDLVEMSRQQGRTVILTTHYMEEAHRLADRVIILDHGHIVGDGPPDALIRQYAPNQVIRVSGEHLADLERLGWHPVQGTPGEWQRPLNENEPPLESILAEARQSGALLQRVSIEESSLEDVFLRLTGRSLSA
jgi:ABC-2 type transport system ATP-binding protein